MRISAPSSITEAFQRQFHQSFGLGPRNQRFGPDLQVKAPETPASGEVGHRLAAGPPLHQRLESRLLVRGRGIASVGEQPCRPPPEHMRQQQLRLAGWQARAGCAQEGVDGFHRQYLSI